MNPQDKFKERTIALLFAVVIITTAIAAGAAFSEAAGIVPTAVEPAVNVGIVVAIVLNGLASAALWFYGRAHITTTDVKKVWDMASGALLSVLWDVLALGLALSVSASPSLYAWLGIALVADDVIDIVVHYKR